MEIRFSFQKSVLEKMAYALQGSSKSYSIPVCLSHDVTRALEPGNDVALWSVFTWRHGGHIFCFPHKETAVILLYQVQCLNKSFANSMLFYANFVSCVSLSREWRTLYFFKMPKGLIVLNLFLGILEIKWFTTRIEFTRS